MVKSLFTTVLISIAVYSNSHAQCSITATDNSYRVDVALHVVSLIIHPTEGDCTFKSAIIQYDIDFVSLNGAPPPSSMYTLQGTVICNGKSMFFDLPNEGGPHIGGVPLAWATTESATAGGNPFNPSHGSCSGYDVSYCDQIQVTIQGPNIPYQNIICTPVPTPLAVRLESFDLNTPDNNSVHINWSTSDEKDVSHFILEHSSENGVFEIISRKDASGKANTTTNYSFIHKNQKTGIHIYRLIEVDYSGVQQILETKAIKLSGNNSLSIYPNPTPAGSTTNFLYTPKNGKSTKINIYSTIGGLIDQFEVKQQSTEIKLQKGQYFVHLIEDDSTIEVKSLIIF